MRSKRKSNRQSKIGNYEPLKEELRKRKAKIKGGRRKRTGKKKHASSKPPQA